MVEWSASGVTGFEDKVGSWGWGSGRVGHSKDFLKSPRNLVAESPNTDSMVSECQSTNLASSSVRQPLWLV